MLRKAASSQTAVMVATPHSGDRGRWDKVESLRRLCQDLNQALESDATPLKLVLGMENALDLDTVDKVEQGNGLTINGSSYILVELPFHQLPLYWEEVLFRLQLNGLQPIIAHPERQSQIQSNPSLLVEAVERGILFQLTAGSLTGHFGPQARKCAETLLKKRLAHFIASDCHGQDGSRGPNMLDGFQRASKLVGEELAVQMVRHAPWDVVHGTKGAS